MGFLESFFGRSQPTASGDARGRLTQKAEQSLPEEALPEGLPLHPSACAHFIPSLSLKRLNIDTFFRVPVASLGALLHFAQDGHQS